MDFAESIRKLTFGVLATFVAGGGAIANAQAATGKPNILFIMGDDIGIMHRPLLRRRCRQPS